MDLGFGAELTVPLVLVVLSLVTSALTAAMGAGGGLLMLAAMAGLMPPAAVVPVHGIVQLGSNGGRAILAARHVDRRITGWLLAGGIVGAAAGSLVLVQLPLALLQLSIATFILLVVWVPLPGIGATGRPGISGFGALAGFLALFVGATGPLVGAFMQRQALQRHATVATMAACQTGLNVCKLLAFGVAGFLWRQWLPLAALMVLSGFAGTWIGLRLLTGLSERRFRVLFRIVLSVLALHAAWRGIEGLVTP